MANKSKYFNPLTREEFDTIKELLYRGELPHQIHQELGRSSQVIKIISTADSFEDYPMKAREFWRVQTEKQAQRDEAKRARTLPQPIQIDKEPEQVKREVAVIEPTFQEKLAGSVTQIVIDELERYHEGFIEKLKGTK